MKWRHILTLSALALGCANGDGRGFATVSGTVSVSLEGDSFTAADGRAGTIDSMRVGVAAMRLEVLGQAVDGGTEDRRVDLPVGSHWAPLLGSATIPYGPFEVIAGDFDTFGAVLSSVEMEITVGDEIYTYVVVQDGGIPVLGPAELAANDERPPVISITSELVLDAAMLEGFDPAAEDAASVLAARITATGLVNATWVRQSD